MIYESVSGIPESEYRDRYRRTQERMQRDGYDLILAWSDCYRMSNVRWLADYRPYDGVIPYSTLVTIPAKGDPILFATPGLLSSAQASSWITDVRNIRTDLGAALTEYAASGGVKRVGIGGYKYLALETWEIIRKAFPSGIAVGRTRLIDELKSVKSENEIRLMHEAGRLADVGCQAVMDAARVGVTERELVRAAYSAMFAGGADTIAFDVFVQTGENSAGYYLMRPTDRRLQDGDLIMIDMGCRHNGYASDNARGASFGNVSREAQRVLDVCYEAWHTGMQHIKPGVTCGEICAIAQEVLIRNGYMKPGDTWQCGHGTGMDPEEEFPVVFTGSEDKLLENQSICYAITLLAPGIGGCRVEDPVIVRKNGPESLSKFSYHNHWPART